MARFLARLLYEGFALRCSACGGSYTLGNEFTLLLDISASTVGIELKLVSAELLTFWTLFR